jgi:hypothetical protein
MSLWVSLLCLFFGFCIPSLYFGNWWGGVRGGIMGTTHMATVHNHSSSSIPQCLCLAFPLFLLKTILIHHLMHYNKCMYVFDIEQCLHKYTFLLSFSKIVYQCVEIKGTVARKEKKGGKEETLFFVLTDKGKGKGSCFNGSNRECSCCNVIVAIMYLG